MGRLWGQIFAAVIITALVRLAAPQSLLTSPWVLYPFTVVIVGLLGSGLIAAFTDVSKWPDRGVVVGTIWGLAGMEAMTLVLGPGIWSFGPSTAGSTVNLGSMAWPIVVDLVLLAVGMAALGVVAVLALLGVAAITGRRAGPSE